MLARAGDRRRLGCGIPAVTVGTARMAMQVIRSAARAAARQGRSPAAARNPL